VIHSIGSVLSLKIGGGSPQGFEGTTMAQADDVRASIKVCMFDQYGTVVDMQTGLTEAAAPFLAPEVSHNQNDPLPLASIEPTTSRT